MKRKAYPCLLATVVSFLGNPALGQQTETLADVLAHNSIATDAAAIVRLHSPVTSYEVVNDSQEFVIGYYLAHEDNQLDFPLFLSRLDKGTGEWRHAELKDIKVSDPDQTDGGSFKTDCLGSVTKIKHKADRYYLDLHWNPSAECLLILHDDLTVDNTLPGWELAVLKGVVL